MQFPREAGRASLGAPPVSMLRLLFPLLALDGPIRRNAKKLGLSLVELDL